MYDERVCHILVERPHPLLYRISKTVMFSFVFSVATNNSRPKLWEDRPVESIDLKTSTIKPIHARWIIKAFQNIKRDKTMIIQSFNNCGIYEK